MIIHLLRVELLKIRRSLALFMILACPLMVLLLTLGVDLKSKTPMGWQMFWMSTTAIWSYFMLPLYIALITGLLNGTEHKNATWRLMLTLPISNRQLYLSKLVLAGISVLAANLALILFVLATISIFSMAGRPISDAFKIDFLRALWVLSVSSLPILVFQHWISWRFQNIVAPLVAGVVSTMGILQIGQSKDWIYYPWSYIMMAMQGSDPVSRSQALTLALLVATGLTLVSCYWIGRRGAANL